MAYLFGAGATDCITCGTSVTHASNFSWFIRVKFTSANATLRRLLQYQQISGSYYYNFDLYLSTGATNEITQAVGGSNGTVYVVNTAWTSGFTAGSIHTLVGTYWQDGLGYSQLRLYADTDSTPKEDSGLVTAVIPDQQTDQVFCIGNLSGFSNSCDATIYEVGWWPNVVLTGAEAAGMGAGTPPATAPDFYWPLISDAVALYGGQNGTVTGATVVAHSGTNLYSGAPPATGAEVLRHGANRGMFRAANRAR